MSKTVGSVPTTELLVASTPQDLGPAAASEAFRLGAIAGGGLLALYGLRRGGWLGLASLVAGGAAMAGSRRIGLRPYQIGIREARAAVTVLADATALHAWWRFDGLPQLLSCVASVEERGVDGARIHLYTVSGGTLAWDVKIAEDDPGRRLSFRSTDASAVPGECEIVFRPAPGDRGTEVHAWIELGPPASIVAAVLSGELGNAGEPGVSLADDLRRMKQRIETGEVATTDGQPRGAGRRTLQRAARRELPVELARETHGEAR
ncbi:MAG: hypothetical protein ABMB14_36295 [Myxococcota bacterium]